MKKYYPITDGILRSIFLNFVIQWIFSSVFSDDEIQFGICTGYIICSAMLNLTFMSRIPSTCMERYYFVSLSSFLVMTPVNFFLVSMVQRIFHIWEGRESTSPGDGIGILLYGGIFIAVTGLSRLIAFIYKYCFPFCIERFWKAEKNKYYKWYCVDGIFRGACLWILFFSKYVLRKNSGYIILTGILVLISAVTTAVIHNYGKVSLLEKFLTSYWSFAVLWIAIIFAISDRDVTVIRYMIAFTAATAGIRVILYFVYMLDKKLGKNTR